MGDDTCEQASRRITMARTKLILKQPFFGALALRLEPTVDMTCSTAWTDGARLGYNPDFVNSLILPELVGVLCHEILHVANGHPWRFATLPFPPIPADTPPEIADRLKTYLRHSKANRAADYAINYLIKESGMTLPASVLDDRRYHGMALEQIYPLLDDLKVTTKDVPSLCDGDGCGGVRPATGSVSEQASQQADWTVAVTQAASAARQAGNLPACLDRFIKDLLRPKVDWRAILRRFIQEAARNDYTWCLPSTRYLAAGLYLPRLRSEDMGEIVFAIDTSGSVMNELQQFCCEVNAAVSECLPERVHVVYCDAAVGRADTFERGDWITFDTVGGGGTDFRPVFKYVAKQGITPICLVYLTDLEGPAPDHAPDYPVLWVTVTGLTAPWGETVRMERTG